MSKSRINDKENKPKQIKGQAVFNSIQPKNLGINLVEYKKQVRTLQANEENYEERKQKFLDDAKKRLGDDFMENYHLPKGFDLFTYGREQFEKVDIQKGPLPIPNSMIKHLIDIPKKSINYPFMLNSNGKFVCGVYMLGNDNGKPVLYSLSIVTELNNNDFLQFNIKLDVCLKGEEWMPLIRLDSDGVEHPNFIKDGKVVKNVYDITMAPTPHLHVNSEECQVLIDGLRYTTAQPLDKSYLQSKDSKDPTFFKKCMNYFMNYTNLQIDFNKTIEDTLHYDFKNPLIDDTKTDKVFNI